MVLAACALDAAGDGVGGTDGGSGADAQSDRTTRPPPADASRDTTLDAPAEASKDAAKDAVADKSAPEDGAAPDAACTADLKTDPLNCGSCDHSCLGGGCAGGQCQPIMLASSSKPAEIALQGGTTLYWTTSGMMNTVYSCSVSGCAPAGVGGCGGTLGIAVDSAQYYFTCNMQNEVYACPNAGCGGPVMGQMSPTGITVDSTAFYWLWQAMGGAGHSGQVMMASLDGGSVTTLRDGQNFPSDIAVQAGMLYWTETGAPYNQVSSCSVADCGGDYGQIATNQNNPDQITVDSVNAYFTNNGMSPTSGDGSVVQVPLGGGTAMTLASSQAFPRGIVVTSTLVYWVNQGATPGSGTVNSVPIGGGASPDVLAMGQEAPWGLTQDSVSLYWTNNAGGQIMRLAK
jgi:hypothetical protein